MSESSQYDSDSDDSVELREENGFIERLFHLRLSAIKKKEFHTQVQASSGDFRRGRTPLSGLI